MCVQNSKPRISKPPSFSIVGNNIPPGQSLNNTHDLLCRICKMSSFRSVPVITPLWGGKCNWTRFIEGKVKHKKQMLLWDSEIRNCSGVSVCFQFWSFMVLGERNDQGLSPLTFQHTQISGCSLLISSFFRREGTIKEAVSSFSKDVWRIYAVHRIFARQVKENGYTMCESFYKRACSLLRNKDIHMKSEVPYIIKSKMPQTLRQFQRC